jgi:hypothetical protein
MPLNFTQLESSKLLKFLISEAITMHQPDVSYLDWLARFATQADCLEAIAGQRWPDGFRCPHCGHDHAFILSRGHKRQCAHCRYQVSPTAGTVFHRTHAPLPKWFAALYLMSADKGGNFVGAVFGQVDRCQLAYSLHHAAASAASDA